MRQLAPAASDTDQLPISPVREGGTAGAAGTGAVATRGGAVVGAPGAVPTPGVASPPDVPASGGTLALVPEPGGGKAEDSTSPAGAGVSGAGACAWVREAE